MKGLKISVFLFILAFASDGLAQDAFFTNPSHSLVYLNPSFSGSNGFIRNQTSYRNQWPSIIGTPFVSIANSFDAYIKPLKAGVSLTALLDDQFNGLLTTNWYSFAYAQHFFLLDKKLKVIPSLQITYINERLDKTKLNFGDGYNFRYPMIWQNGLFVPGNTKTNVDFSSGLLLQYNNFYFGGSVFHLLQPDIGLAGTYKLPLKTTLHASYTRSLNPSSFIQVSGFANIQSGTSHSQFNCMASWKVLVAGLGYFYEKSDYLSIRFPRFYTGKSEYHNLTASAGFRYKWFGLAYTYDFSIFTNNEYMKNPGSHQLSVSLNFKSKKDSTNSYGAEPW